LASPGGGGGNDMLASTCTHHTKHSGYYIFIILTIIIIMIIIIIILCVCVCVCVQHLHGAQCLQTPKDLHRAAGRFLPREA